MAQAAVAADYPLPRTSEVRAPAAPAAIQVEAVTRSFGETEVLHPTSLAIYPREIFGLIGPSGSGKTTLMRMLVGLSAPSSGSIRVRGVEPTRFRTRDRERIGYVPQQFILYPSLTVEQNARFVAGLYGLGWLRRRRRIREVLRTVELWDSRKKLARNISGGMQRRLMLASALLHSPPVLFIDEPTAGLNPVLRAKVWGHLQELRDAGATIAVTTQNLEDAGQCDRVALLRAGSIAALGSPSELKRLALGGEAIDIEAESLQRAHVEGLRFLPGVRSVTARGWGSIRVVVDEAATATVLVTDWLRQRGVQIESIRTHEPGFEEAFLAIVRPDEAAA